MDPTIYNDLIAITGSTGNVGSSLVSVLGAKGFRTCTLVRTDVKDNSDPLSRHFDFMDPTTFRAAFEGVKALFLMRPPAIAKSHLITAAIDAAIAAGVERITFLSIQGAEKNQLVPHYAIERHLQRTTVSWTFLRAAFFMQNLTTTHRDDIRDHDDLLMPAGNGRTTFVDVRDVAAAAAITLTEDGHANKAYELTGSTAPTYMEVAAVLSHALGRTIRYTPSVFRFWRRMRDRGHPVQFILVMIALYTVARLGRAGHLTDDLPQLIGRPAITLEQFATDSVGLWRR